MFSEKGDLLFSSSQSLQNAIPLPNMALKVVMLLILG
jgi:hypothetical protein